jgi:hypothetical protein
MCTGAGQVHVCSPTVQPHQCTTLTTMSRSALAGGKTYNFSPIIYLQPLLTTPNPQMAKRSRAPAPGPAERRLSTRRAMSNPDVTEEGSQLLVI